MRIRAEWIYIGALLLAPFVLFHDVLSAYWRADDPAILLHAVSSPRLAAFYDPLDWRKLSPSNLTPWLTLSFKLDHRLAGASPRFFYAHQLIACASVALAGYALARKWARPLIAFLGVVLFLAGASTASVVELLMTRHYLEGLLLALLALLGFLRALERQELRWALAGAVAYALAATAKEVYVPLVLVLLAVPNASVRERLSMAWPFLVAALLYIPWRGYMLGSLLGGYAAHGQSSLTMAEGIWQTASRLPAILWGRYWIGPSLALFALLAYRAWNDVHFIGLLAVVVLALMAPLIPLVHSSGITGPDRYTFVLWFVLCIGGTALFYPWSKQCCAAPVTTAFPVLFLLALVGLSCAYQQVQRDAHRAMYREFEVQGRFIDGASARQGMVPSEGLLGGYWYAIGLLALREREGLSRPFMLIRGLPQTGHVDELYRYNPIGMRMQRMDEPLGPFMAQWTASDLRAPLSAELHIRDGVLQWTLGPYADGQYFLASQFAGRHSVPREGAVKVAVGNQPFYQVQHESVDGRLTTSPVFEVQTGVPVTWTRP